MKRIQQGFTLIELMIVVAIVGILAAIALPAYQDYVIRSKLSESEAALAARKTSIQEYASSHSSWPTDATIAGCSTTASQYVAGLGATNAGVITATTNSSTGATPASCTLTMSPQGTGPTNITGWTGSSSCLAKYVPSSFR